MHDLNTINRLNYQAHAASIETHRRDGRHVLARYEGVHLVGYDTYTDLDEAQRIQAERQAERQAGTLPGTQFTLWTAHAAEKTVADIVARTAT